MTCGWEHRGIILQGHQNISHETIQICHSHKMQLILWGWSKTGRYVAF